MFQRSPKLVGFLILILLGMPGVTSAQLVLYDDFRAAGIDPEKWHGQEGSSGPLKMTSLFSI